MRCRRSNNFVIFITQNLDGWKKGADTCTTAIGHELAEKCGGVIPRQEAEDVATSRAEAV